MSENTKKPDPKIEAINDLMAVSTIMEDYWRFHPANPIKEKIENDIKKIDA